MKYSYFLGLLIYILFNAALVFSSVYIITQFAPAAAGSGIPEIKAYLNGMLQCNHCFTSTSFNIYENVGGRGTWTSFQVSSIWKLLTSIFFCVWCTLNLVWYQAFLCCRYWYSWYSPVPDSHWKGGCCVILFAPPAPPLHQSVVTMMISALADCHFCRASFYLSSSDKNGGKSSGFSIYCMIWKVMDFDSSFELLLWQILGSIGSVGGGLALGKEGPLVHTGACIASVLGQVKS